MSLGNAFLVFFVSGLGAHHALLRLVVLVPRGLFAFNQVLLRGGELDIDVSLNMKIK